MAMGILPVLVQCRPMGFLAVLPAMGCLVVLGEELISFWAIVVWDGDVMVLVYAAVPTCCICCVLWTRVALVSQLASEISAYSSGLC